MHKLDGMVDVKNKKCIHNGCQKQPFFNKENEKNALYCSLHKLEGMVDILSKTCIHTWLNALSLQIDYWRELSNKTIEVIQLFYDS